MPRRERLLLRALPDAAEDHGVAQRAGAGRRWRSSRRSARRARASGVSTSARMPSARPGGDRSTKRLQDRQRERRRLAGAGLRAAEQVAAREDVRDRLRLDRRRRGVALGRDGAQDRRDQPELGKGGHVRVAFWMAGAGQRRWSVQAIPRAAEAASHDVGRLGSGGRLECRCPPCALARDQVVISTTNVDSGRPRQARRVQPGRRPAWRPVP